MNTPSSHLGRFLLVTSVLVLIAIAGAFIPMEYSLPLIVGMALIVCAWIFKYPLLYTGIALIPAVGLSLNLANIPLLRSIPIVGSWNAPIGDFIILTLVIVCGSYMLHDERKKHIYHHVKDHLPAIAWLTPFFLIVLVSIFKAPRELQLNSLNYALRFVLFSYVGYTALLYWMIKTKKQLSVVMQVFTGSSALIAFLSVITVLTNEPFWGVWRRVAPFSWGQFMPFGHNHNQLAEVLVVAIPLAWLMAIKKTGHRWLWGWAACLMIVVTLFTFGRTAWIVLTIQACAAWWMLRPEKITHQLVRAWPLAVVLLSMAIYMTIFSSSDYVAASTQARLDLTKFTLIQAAQTPWMGHGIGTFYPTIGVSRAFILMYGDAIEAHGFVQKLLFETGILGTGAFLLFFGWLFFRMMHEFHHAHNLDYKHLVCAVYIAVLGAFIFQIFNTSYFNAKLWFPVGLALIVLFGKWKFKSST